MFVCRHTCILSTHFKQHPFKLFPKINIISKNPPSDSQWRQIFSLLCKLWICLFYYGIQPSPAVYWYIYKQDLLLDLIKDTDTIFLSTRRPGQRSQSRNESQTPMHWEKFSLKPEGGTKQLTWLILEKNMEDIVWLYKDSCEVILITLERTGVTL